MFLNRQTRTGGSHIKIILNWFLLQCFRSFSAHQWHINELLLTCRWIRSTANVMVFPLRVRRGALWQTWTPQSHFQKSHYCLTIINWVWFQVQAFWVAQNSVCKLKLCNKTVLICMQRCVEHAVPSTLSQSASRLAFQNEGVTAIQHMSKKAGHAAVLHLHWLQQS